MLFNKAEAKDLKRLLQLEYQNSRRDCERAGCRYVSIEGPPIRQRQSSRSQMVRTPT
jgi:hypothetical protein